MTYFSLLWWSKQISCASNDDNLLVNNCITWFLNNFQIVYDNYDNMHCMHGVRISRVELRWLFDRAMICPWFCLCFELRKNSLILCISENLWQMFSGHNLRLVNKEACKSMLSVSQQLDFYCKVKWPELCRHFLRSRHLTITCRLLTNWKTDFG